MLGSYIDLGNPMATHPLNEGRVCWLYGLPNPYTGGMYWRDLTRKQNNGLIGGASLPAWVRTPFGYGPNLVVAGSQYVDLNVIDSLIVGATKVVASMWVNRTSGTVSTMWRGYNNLGGFGLIWFTDNNGYGCVNQPASGGYNVYPLGAVSGWQHLQIAFDGSQSTDITRLRLWLNGKQVTSSSTNGSIATTVSSGSPGWSLGRYWAGSYGYQTGAVTDHSVWIGRTWSDRDAWDNYNFSRHGYPPGGPLRYWSRKTLVMGGATSPPPPPPPAAGNLYWWNTYGAASRV